MVLVRSSIALALALWIILYSIDGQAGENPIAPPYQWPSGPKFNLQVKHQPLKDWWIQVVPAGEGSVYLNQKGQQANSRGTATHLNTALKGPDECVFRLFFDYRDYRKQGGPAIPELEKKPDRPVFLGWDYHDFSKRFHRNTGERGFQRNYINPAEFGCRDGSVALSVPKFEVQPHFQFSDWQRFLMPVVRAEGGGDFLVVNSFDRAGMTVGFMQMAAHTPNDMIPMLKHLIQNKELQRCSYANPQRWFPELGITTDGKLGYIDGNQIHSLEEVSSTRNSNEGFRQWAYFREDFVRFCNPCVKTINRSEVEFAARWLMWSMSPKMRQAQIYPTVQNVLTTLRKLENAPRKVSAADAAIATVILHWKDGKEFRRMTSQLLHAKCAVQTFMSWEGEAGKKIAKSPSELKILRQRVATVRQLFQNDPQLYRRLQALTFDFETGQLGLN